MCLLLLLFNNHIQLGMFLESHITLGLERKEQFTIHFRVLLHTLPCDGEEKHLQFKVNETSPSELPQ